LGERADLVICCNEHARGFVPSLQAPNSARHFDDGSRDPAGHEPSDQRSYHRGQPSESTGHEARPRVARSRFARRIAHAPPLQVEQHIPCGDVVVEGRQHGVVNQALCLAPPSGLQESLGVCAHGDVMSACFLDLGKEDALIVGVHLLFEGLVQLGNLVAGLPLPGHLSSECAWIRHQEQVKGYAGVLVDPLNPLLRKSHLRKALIGDPSRVVEPANLGEALRTHRERERDHRRKRHGQSAADAHWLQPSARRAFAYDDVVSSE